VISIHATDQAWPISAITVVSAACIEPDSKPASAGVRDRIEDKRKTSVIVVAEKIAISPGNGIPVVVIAT
jgi:hypothetical protein